MTSIEESEDGNLLPLASEAADAPAPRDTWWARVPVWVWSLLAVVVLAGLFLATRPGNHTEAEDAWRYAAGVRDGGEINLGAGTHPYTPMVLRPVYLALDGLGLGVSAQTLMEVVSAVSAALTVVLLVVLLQRGVSSGTGVAVAGAAGLCASYVFWRYSAEMETYALGMAISTAAVAYAYLGKPRMRWVGVCALLTAAATVSHLLNSAVLFAAVPLVLWWRAPAERRVRWVAIQVGVGFVIAVALWAMRPLVAPNAGHEFFDPATTSAIEAPTLETVEAGLAPRNIVETPVGLSQAIISTNFLFAHSSFRDFTAEVFGARQLDEEFYMGERAGPFVAWFPFATLVVVIGLATWVAVASRRGFRSRVMDPAVAPLAAWFVLYLVMLAVSEPANPELWAMSLPALWGTVAAVLFAPLWAKRRWLPIALVAVLGLHNLVGGAIPVMASSSDWWEARTEWLLENAEAGDLILLSDDNIVGGYLQYHSPAQTVLLAKLPQEEFDEAVETMTTTGGTVWTLPGTLDPQKRHWMSEPEYQRMRDFADAHGDEFELAHEDQFGGVYKRCLNGAC